MRGQSLSGSGVTGGEVGGSLQLELETKVMRMFVKILQSIMEKAPILLTIGSTSV